MSKNPYLTAHQRGQRNRRRVEGAWSAVARALLPALGVLVLIPLVRPVFLHFLDASPEGWGEGMEGVLQRFGIALVALLTLDVYTALIRSPDRAVLDLLPVDPGQVAAFQVRRVAAERWWLVPAGAAFLLPVALEAGASLWAMGVVVLLGAWVLGLAASALVHLRAVDVAEDPRWEGLLDLLRGQNPRPQAAFLYAPGVILLVAGGAVAVAAAGVRLLHDGLVWGGGLLVLPFLLAVAAWVPLHRTATRTWFRASAVLADIDARHAALADRDEGQRAYLDWTVRFLPPPVRRYALKDLRHGWRARRGWITGAWLAGVMAGLVGWAGDAEAPVRAAATAMGAVWLVATVGVLMARDDPPFLRAWIPAGGGAALLARFLALVGWAQGCLWPAALAVAIRHGVAEAAWLVGMGLGAAVLAGALATACARLPERGLLLYGPVAAVAAVGGAAFMMGGAP